MSISEKINSIIKETLPENTAKELKKYLQEAEELKKELENVKEAYGVLKEQNEKHVANIVKLEKENDELRKRDIQVQTDLEKVKIDKEAIRIEKSDLEKVNATFKATYAEQSKNDLFDMLRIMFKNPVMQSQTIKNINDETYNGNTYQTDRTTHNESVTETKGYNND